MDTREENITDAHARTFQWILKAPSDARWSDFSEWLTSGTEQLYWITGKFGSGKSTLMRYVCGSNITADRLRTWSGSLPLLTAAFYFWSSGSALQCSQQGMMRSLLCQLLQQLYPSAVVLKALFRRVRAYSIGGTTKTWTLSELKEALGILLKDLSATSKVALFVDGLDEFEGEKSDLLSWMKSFSLPNIKLCVSSRPWNVFEYAFKQRPSLMLHHLTKDDILRYVGDKLHIGEAFENFVRAEGPTAAESLGLNIAEKAQGVFLWVYLVVRSLLDGLTGGERHVDLQRRLDDLPPDLEALFDKLLWRPEHKSKLESASEILQLERASSNLLTLRELIYAIDYDDNFALDESLQVQVDSHTEAYAKSMSRRVRECTAGLLDTSAPPESSGLAHASIVYLHRTVRDYVEQEDVWQRLLVAN